MNPCTHLYFCPLTLTRSGSLWDRTWPQRSRPCGRRAASPELGARSSGGPRTSQSPTIQHWQSVRLTDCTRALLEAFSRARAPVELLTFCLLTSIWLYPGSSSAGRFSADILAARSSKNRSDRKFECIYAQGNGLSRRECVRVASIVSCVLMVAVLQNSVDLTASVGFCTFGDGCGESRPLIGCRVSACALIGGPELRPPTNNPSSPPNRTVILPRDTRRNDDDFLNTAISFRIGDRPTTALLNHLRNVPEFGAQPPSLACNPRQTDQLLNTFTHPTFTQWRRIRRRG